MRCAPRGLEKGKVAVEAFFGGLVGDPESRIETP